VKGQTPKVEKTANRKKLTGRAKKRKAYNERFLNVVMGAMRPKKPNAAKQAAEREKKALLAAKAAAAEA
jgi:ribosomal protein S30